MIKEYKDRQTPNPNQIKKMLNRKREIKRERNIRGKNKENIYRFKTNIIKKS